ncbi:hypothetical protein HanXRQr2_Chr16g0739031 [Helianthus annuus]|uniref:Uncharacterized protein n=1 Tax=Helianthus annuus TaxID=4232 RepID=A0A9K3GZH0_HELAN|nr:hypothetical protein HanXRQr2_Chr16g0739031 [Helianthus annuus]
MTNGLSNPRNHASSSSASTKAEKRKEYQKRYTMLHAKKITKYLNLGVVMPPKVLHQYL